MKKKIQIFIPLIGGSIIGILNNYSIYNELTKPLFAPPSIVFPIAWTIIYILIGISYYIVEKDKDLVFVYYLQLIFNYLWPVLFFTFKLRLLSIFWICMLLGFIIILLQMLKQKKKLSFYLLIPYLLWIIYAIYLNIGFYVLN